MEVDIVMPGETLLSLAHDVSQDLQDQLETLPNVERAFVHVDHEVSHQPVGAYSRLSRLPETDNRSQRQEHRKVR